METHALMVQQRAHAIDRFLVQLERRQQVGGVRERGDDPDVRVRIRVDHAHIEVWIDRAKEGAKIAGKGRMQPGLALEQHQRIGSRHENVILVRNAGASLRQ